MSTPPPTTVNVPPASVADPATCRAADIATDPRRRERRRRCHWLHWRLVKVAVASVESTRLLTASPTYTDAVMLIVALPVVVHDVPFDD